MNKEILEKLSNYPKNEKEYNFIHLDNLAYSFYKWLFDVGYVVREDDKLIDRVKLNVAGKNFINFDYQFLKNAPQFNDYFKIIHRTIDPAILYVDWQLDETLPDTKTCCQRAGIELINEHTALGDAFTVIQLLRKKEHFNSLAI
jgi:hypothetical protein